MNPRDEKLKKAAEQAQREWEQAIDATDAARLVLDRARKVEWAARKKARQALERANCVVEIGGRLSALSRRSRN